MSGELRNRVEFLTPLRTDDEAGGAAVAWNVGADCWAEVERLASTRDFAGDRDNRLRRIAVTMRFTQEAVFGARLRFQGADYEIVSIESADGRLGGRDRRLTLICEEVLS